MTYCVYCGVELADCEKKCPLCHTEVILPGQTKMSNRVPCTIYPAEPDNVVARNGLVFILALIIIVPAILTAMCDIIINFSITWSGYVIGASALLCLAILTPIMSRYKHPLVFIALDLAGISAFLLLIQSIAGGNWFIPFALPLMIGISLTILTLTALTLYTDTSAYILAAAYLISIGSITVWIEYCIRLAFFESHKLVWSLYPFGVLLIFGVILFFINRNAAFKEKLKRKFFI